MPARTNSRLEQSGVYCELHRIVKKIISVHVSVFLVTDRASFLGISVVGQSNRDGDGGIYVGSIMKGSVVFHFCYESLSLL